MKREHFVKVVEEVLDSLPQEFRSRIRNVAVLVEDMPPNQPSPQSGQQRRLLLGLFHGVPTTKKSIFDLPTGPDYIVLYQKNIEAVCSSEAGVREQIRLTVIHELGHYFGGVKNKFAKILTQHCLAEVVSQVWFPQFARSRLYSCRMPRASRESMASCVAPILRDVPIPSTSD